MKQILVARDLSSRAERALRRAFDLAGQHGADISVLAVVDDDLPAAIAERRRAETADALDQLCGSITDAPYTPHVVPGDPSRTIAAFYAESGADLLVLGRHRPRPIMDLFTGATMERIVRAVTGPVLLVRDAVDHPYKTALTGVDFSPSSVQAIWAATALAPGIDIHTFHAVHVPYAGGGMPGVDMGAFAGGHLDDSQAEIDDWWSEAELPPESRKPTAEQGALGETMMRHLHDLKPQLLVVGAHGRPKITLSRLGGFTEEILRSPPCDVLVVRA